MKTSTATRLAFPLGTVVETTDPGHLLRGDQVRRGNVAGYCNSGESSSYVRVRWEGWRLNSSVVIDSAKLKAVRS